MFEILVWLGAALSVAGVHEVINDIRTRGVDTHIPADADE